MSETTDEMEYVLRNCLEQAERTIADLRHRLDAETYTVIQLNSIGEKYKASLRHSNYKRCLTMAMWCRRSACFYDTMREYGLYWGMKSDRAYKWYKRWLKLAEKFKEAS